MSGLEPRRCAPWLMIPHVRRCRLLANAPTAHRREMRRKKPMHLYGPRGSDGGPSDGPLLVTQLRTGVATGQRRNVAPCGGDTPCPAVRHGRHRRSPPCDTRYAARSPCTNSSATRRCSSKGAATARPHAPVRSMTQRRRSAGWPPATDPARDGRRDRATAERGAMWRRHPMSSGALARPATSNAADVFPDRKDPIHREAATRWAGRA